MITVNKLEMKTNLIFFLARFGLGGAGNSVYKLCKALNKKKYNINVICLKECAYESSLRKAGIKIFKIKSERVLLAIFKVLNISSVIIYKSKTKIPKSFFINKFYHMQSFYLSL